MAKNINFISATELPEATGEEVSVLCLENGEMKQKPANGLGGGEKPDMVITVNVMPNIQVSNGNYTITEGGVDAVFAAIRAGRYPIVKIRYYDGDNDGYIVMREEYNASVCTYGERLWVAYIAATAAVGISAYYHKLDMFGDGTLSTSYVKAITLTE